MKSIAPAFAPRLLQAGATSLFARALSPLPPAAAFALAFSRRSRACAAAALALAAAWGAAQTARADDVYYKTIVVGGTGATEIGEGYGDYVIV